jgi:hypothetical protein
MIEIDRKPHKTIEYFNGILKADRDYKFVLSKSINGKVEYKVVELDGSPADDHRDDNGHESEATIAVRLHIIATIEKRASEYFTQVKEEDNR